MSKKIAALITGASLMVGLSTAVAGDFYELSPGEMDRVTAGITSSFTRTFVQTDPFPPRRVADTVTLETPSGTLTSVFDAIFISFRQTSSQFNFNRSIQTTAIFD
jgi:hypothetical protein